MNFSIPRSNYSEMVLYIWKIIEIPNISINDLIYRISFRQVRKMDRKFWVDEKCDGCEICARVCPAANIKIIDGRPSWLHRCEQCLACLQWCPQEAIQYGKNTIKYPRYHHPEIILDDMLEQAKVKRK